MISRGLIKKGEIFKCIKEVRMENDGELVYVEEKFYKSGQDECITDEAGRIEHYWNDPCLLNEYFIRSKNHKRKHGH